MSKIGAHHLREGVVFAPKSSPYAEPACYQRFTDVIGSFFEERAGMGGLSSATPSPMLVGVKFYPSSSCDHDDD